MRKIYKFLVLAIFTLAIFAAFEVQIIDAASVQEGASVERTAYIPPKSKICLPPQW